MHSKRQSLAGLPHCAHAIPRRGASPPAAAGFGAHGVGGSGVCGFGCRNLQAWLARWGGHGFCPPALGSPPAGCLPGSTKPSTPHTEELLDFVAILPLLLKDLESFK